MVLDKGEGGIMYRCEFFVLRELVPPGVFESRGESAWELFDDRALYLRGKK